ncbi:MAG: ATP-binding protein [Gemmataceae bacterium]|nr:ATP-binding protein [Gemmataceae bacterium]
MKSIRLSLVVYLILLQSLALGASGWLAYRTADEKLSTEQVSHYALLAKQHDEKAKAIRDRFDEELLAIARRIAKNAAEQPQFRQHQATQVIPVGLITAGLAPHGEVLMPVWVASGSRSSLHLQILRRLVTEIVVPEEQLPRDVEFAGSEFFQINSEWASLPAWRSRSLGAESLPFDPGQVSSLQVVDWAYDDITLPNGEPGRRIQFKTPVSRFRFLRTPGLPPVPPTSDTAIPPVQQPPVTPAEGRPERLAEMGVPFIVIQCAFQVDQRDRQLDRLNASTTSEMKDVVIQGADARWVLTQRLVLIGLATFAAITFGALFLINHGLAPLRRLGDAVSQVTPQSLRLQFEEAELPRELDPIVDRLRATLEQLRSAFEREKQAVADISHELRTPVTALLATLDVTLKKQRSAEEYRAALVDARAAGGHLRTLVERLLALARLDAGVVPTRIEEVDLNDAVERVAGLIRPLAAEKGLTLQTHCPAGLQWTTDGDKFREVLVNLLHNAVQYNQPGGLIDLRVSSEAGRLVAVIRDTGKGIDPQQLPHLFERFYRADPSREEAALHAGLGLAIVRGYLDLMGGDIQVDSVPGQGTTFRISLPPAPLPRREAA